MAVNAVNDYNPSIGKINGMYHDGASKRIKVIRTSKIFTGQDEVNGFLGKGIQMRGDYGASRFTGRIFAESGVPLPQGYIEANIPLRGDFDGLNLVYMGSNIPERRTSPEIEKQEIEAIRGISGSSRPHDYSGFSFENLSKEPKPEDIETLQIIYENAFTKYMTELNSEEICKMAGSPSNVTYVARNSEGKIVSVVMAENASLPTEAGTFNMSELSEMATAEDYDGRGLSQEAARRIISEINKRNHLTYSESRAPEMSINVVMHRNGMIFRGILPKHCKIGGKREIEENGTDYHDYENLSVWTLDGGMYEDN